MCWHAARYPTSCEGVIGFFFSNFEASNFINNVLANMAYIFAECVVFVVVAMASILLMKFCSVHACVCVCVHLCTCLYVCAPVCTGVYARVHNIYIMGHL